MSCAKAARVNRKESLWLTRPSFATSHSSRSRKGGTLYDYYRYCYEARERADTREHEAENERTIRRQAGRRRTRRRRAQAQPARLRANASEDHVDARDLES